MDIILLFVFISYILMANTVVIKSDNLVQSIEILALIIISLVPIFALHVIILFIFFMWDS